MKLIVNPEMQKKKSLIKPGVYLEKDLSEEVAKGLPVGEVFAPFMPVVSTPKGVTFEDLKKAFNNIKEPEWVDHSFRDFYFSKSWGGFKPGTTLATANDYDGMFTSLTMALLSYASNVQKVPLTKYMDTAVCDVVTLVKNEIVPTVVANSMTGAHFDAGLLAGAVYRRAIQDNTCWVLWKKFLNSMGYSCSISSKLEDGDKLFKKAEELVTEDEKEKLVQTLTQASGEIFEKTVKNPDNWIASQDPKALDAVEEVQKKVAADASYVASMLKGAHESKESAEAVGQEVAEKIGSAQSIPMKHANVFFLDHEYGKAKKKSEDLKALHKKHLPSLKKTYLNNVWDHHNPNSLLVTVSDFNRMFAALTNATVNYVTHEQCVNIMDFMQPVAKELTETVDQVVGPKAYNHKGTFNRGLLVSAVMCRATNSSNWMEEWRNFLQTLQPVGPKQTVKETPPSFNASEPMMKFQLVTVMGESDMVDVTVKAERMPNIITATLDEVETTTIRQYRVTGDVPSNVSPSDIKQAVRDRFSEKLMVDGRVLYHDIVFQLSYETAVKTSKDMFEKYGKPILDKYGKEVVKISGSSVGVTGTISYDEGKLDVKLDGGNNDPKPCAPPAYAKEEESHAEIQKKVEAMVEKASGSIKEKLAQFIGKKNTPATQKEIAQTLHGQMMKFADAYPGLAIKHPTKVPAVNHATGEETVPPSPDWQLGDDFFWHAPAGLKPKTMADYAESDIAATFALGKKLAAEAAAESELMAGKPHLMTDLIAHGNGFIDKKTGEVVDQKLICIHPAPTPKHIDLGASSVFPVSKNVPNVFSLPGTPSHLNDNMMGFTIGDWWSVAGASEVYVCESADAGCAKWNLMCNADGTPFKLPLSAEEKKIIVPEGMPDKNGNVYGPSLLQKLKLPPGKPTWDLSAHEDIASKFRENELMNAMVQGVADDIKKEVDPEVVAQVAEMSAFSISPEAEEDLADKMVATIGKELVAEAEKTMMDGTAPKVIVLDSLTQDEKYFQGKVIKALQVPPKMLGYHGPWPTEEDHED